MVKTYNNIAEYAKKLLIEANPYVDEGDIYVTANTDISSTFRRLKEKDLACIDVSGTEEIPLIHYTIYSESLKEKEKAFSKEREQKILTSMTYLIRKLNCLNLLMTWTRTITL